MMRGDVILSLKNKGFSRARCKKIRCGRIRSTQHRKHNNSQNSKFASHSRYVRYAAIAFSNALRRSAHMKDISSQSTPTLSRFLRMAVVAGVESAVQIHIDRGDDLNARDAQGQTPLMLSAARNKPAICKLLLAAGADLDLLDASGRTALDIAISTGANEVVEAIKTACSSFVIPCVQAPSSGLQHSTGGVLAIAGTATSMFHEFPTACEAGPAATQILESDSEGGDGFDLTGWEAEEEQSPPEDNPALSAAAFEIQSAITEHKPIDTSTDWDDFEASLPDRAAPLPRADDSEARERLRLVLLRAIREGSIPQSAVDDLTLGDDGDPDFEAGSLLSMVINDLGAETDERFEYWSPHENFEVFVTPSEELSEESAVDEAMAFMDDLVGRRNDPFRIYQREFQRETLLTAEAEVALGQDMERRLEKALDALAAWPSGVAAVLEAVKSVTRGTVPLRWLSSAPRVEFKEGQVALGAESDVAAEPTSGLGPSVVADGHEDDDDTRFGDDSKASSDEFAQFCRNAELLAELFTASDRAPAPHAYRDAIAALGLTRNFLLELSDSEPRGIDKAALAFKHAMEDFRRARDRMASSNLKLVVSVAKKYLFSGQPLDDLLQEGNLGLLKAVDRYDWRRGFKFSTYATWWIRQQVGRFVADKGRTIRVPVHIYEKTRRIIHASGAFEAKRGRAPSNEEIATLVDLPVHKAASLVRTALEPLSIEDIDDLDRVISVEAKDRFIARDPMDIVEDAQLVGVVDRFLRELSLKEQCVVRMRFGIGIQEDMTLEEVGARLDVTRERIRQIEAAALRKLTHPARLERLSRELNVALREQGIKGEEKPTKLERGHEKEY